MKSHQKSTAIAILQGPLFAFGHFRLIVLFTLLACLTSTGSSAGNSYSKPTKPTPKETANGIAPDYAIVSQRIHSSYLNNLRKALKSNDYSQNRHNYLSKLSTKQLFEFAVELAEDDQLDLTGIMLVPHLKKQFSKKYPLGEMADIIMNRKHKSKFRAFLLDIATKFPGATTAQTKQKQIKFDDIILSLAEDTQNEPDFRRYALLQLHEKHINKDSKIAKKERLSKIFHEDKSPKVKGAALTAMRRIKSSDMETILDDILVNPGSYNFTVIRHAVVSAAKSGYGDKHIPLLEKIALAKEDEEVYGSTIYSLGLIGTPEAINSIIKAYHKHGFKQCIGSALRKNEKTVRSMLKSSDDLMIKNAIVASQIGELSTAKPSLETITEKNNDQAIRDIAKDAIEKLTDLDSQNRKED